MDDEMTRSHVGLDAVSVRRAKPFRIASRHKASVSGVIVAFVGRAAVVSYERFA